MYQFYQPFTNVHVPGFSGNDCACASSLSSHVAWEWGQVITVALVVLVVVPQALESMPMGDELKWLLKEGGGRIFKNPLSRK